MRVCCLNCKGFAVMVGCRRKGGILYGKPVIMPGAPRNCGAFRPTKEVYVR